MPGNRKRLDIIADIISYVSGLGGKGVKKIWIMYECNLSYASLIKYLSQTLDAGLLILDEDVYKITPKGKIFLPIMNGYKKRVKKIEEEVKMISDEKAELEKMCPPIEAK